MPHIHTRIHTDTRVCTRTARLTTPSMPQAGVQTSSSWLSSAPPPVMLVMSEEGHWVLSWEGSCQGDAQEKQDGKASSELPEQEVSPVRDPHGTRNAPPGKGLGVTQFYQGPAEAGTRLWTLADSDPLSSLFSERQQVSWAVTVRPALHLHRVTARGLFRCQHHRLRAQPLCLLPCPKIAPHSQRTNSIDGHRCRHPPMSMCPLCLPQHASW